jgi:dTMP kinase
MHERNEMTLIVLTGPEGVGKTSHVARIAEYIERVFPQYHVLPTKEVGNQTSLAEKLKSIIADPERFESLSPMSEFLIMSAIRAQHVSQILEPARQRGDIIILDRYIYDTYAYQCAARGACDPEFFYFVTSRLMANFHVPDLIFFLDVDPYTGFRRKMQNGGASKLAKEILDFETKVRLGFQDYFARWPEHKPIPIDTNVFNEEEVSGLILDHVYNLLEKKSRSNEELEPEP